ncbi:hypothetical protein [Robiginitomaculum antarcticum]|uniref:hypothetical protein n=1 Tax=Robiginitomaculum antarcticum TaxID=437507 RepID=UPI0012EA9C13|nr:hypothetical protein [Robiginitomaculum antarcticum]
MKFVAPIFSAKFWLTLMLSMTMSVGAFAADIHPADVDDDACQSAEIVAQSDSVAVSGEIDDGQDNSPAHDHHAHSCGSCHIHIVSNKFSSLTFALSASLNFKIGVDQAAPRAGPLGLYRPPRA